MMKSGMSYEGAVENARSAGILEHDPSLDLEGWDTAFKVLIIPNRINEGKAVEGGDDV